MGGRKRKRKTQNAIMSGSFARMPHRLTDCENYKRLSMDARALLQEANALYNGNNNGDICLAHRQMRRLGWSKRRLQYARHELEHYGFLEITKQGGSHAPTLYALAWLAIQPCNGKHEVEATDKPSLRFLEQCDPWVKPKRKAPTIGNEHSVAAQTSRRLLSGEVPDWGHNGRQN